MTVRRALRALVVLAALPEGETISGKELAARAEGPANYLSKILHILGSAGVIDAHRGSGGGYRLRRAPEKIRLAEVVRLLDGELVWSGGLLSDGPPAPAGALSAADQTWRTVTEAYRRFLEQTTLADMTKGAK
ncbi:MAG: Rrf2 family transcriptional regulator [Bryobacterales bacterium]|nr:Rrf2 family transcriptional regulator [Bryobacterales bacterium]